MQFSLRIKMPATKFKSFIHPSSVGRGWRVGIQINKGEEGREADFHLDVNGIVEIQGQQSPSSLPQKPRLVRITWKRRQGSGVSMVAGPGVTASRRAAGYRSKTMSWFALLHWAHTQRCVLYPDHGRWTGGCLRMPVSQQEWRPPHLSYSSLEDVWGLSCHDWGLFGIHLMGSKA